LLRVLQAVERRHVKDGVPPTDETTVRVRNVDLDHLRHLTNAELFQDAG